MEQRLLFALRKELRNEQQPQLPAVPASVPSSVTKALYSISPLKEKAFEVWLSHVDDAFRGAGMSALFRASAVRSDTWQTNKTSMTSLNFQRVGLMRLGLLCVRLLEEMTLHTQCRCLFRGEMFSRYFALSDRSMNAELSLIKPT